VTTETGIDLGRLGLSAGNLLEIYRFMLLTREIDSRIRTLYLQGKVIGGVYSQVGHEAISVGTASALRPDDILAPTHRDLGAHLVRGMDLDLILAQILARDGGNTAGKDNALHIGDLSLNVLPQISMLGSSIPLAAGAALVAKQYGDDRVSLTYVGDGAVNTGDFHEGLNFAAALRLPMVLIVENNQWAYSTHISNQMLCEEIAQRGEAYGIPGIRIDGNDVLEVYETTRQAVARARAGEGRTLIEFVTMRMRGHSEQDSAAHVPKEMLEEWSRKDPNQRFQALLMEHGVLDEGTNRRMHDEVAARVSEAAEWAAGQPLPEPDSAFQGVYGTPV
jgi:TPP-dependent pyruvate/acetoin dehydrogenase alpha subunit